MNPLRLYYPVGSTKNPYGINQGFGEDPAYYAKFHDSNGNPLKGHDGIDFRAAHGTPVYAAHDGMCHFFRDAHGGEGMSIRTTEPYQFLDGSAYFVVMYFHLIGDTEPQKYPSPIPTDGKNYPVRAGDLIGYADNTGAPYESSGDHLHFGLFPVDAMENTLNVGNGFNGRIDPMPYFTGAYAQDIPQLFALYTKLLPLLYQVRDVIWSQVQKVSNLGGYRKL